MPTASIQTDKRPGRRIRWHWLGAGRTGRADSIRSASEGRISVNSPSVNEESIDGSQGRMDLDPLPDASMAPSELSRLRVRIKPTAGRLISQKL
jgi:hypothetical protein